MLTIAILTVVFWFAFAVILALILAALVTHWIKQRRNSYAVKRWEK